MIADASHSAIARPFPGSAPRPSGEEGPGAVDPGKFRQVLSRFCTGVIVVTALHEVTPVGLTCQAFASLSVEPPLVMFGVATTSRSWPHIRASGRFAVNILREDQEHTSRAFAVSRDDKFAGVSWRPGAHGCPLLDGALAHIECRVEAVHRGGDHDIVVGHVLDLREQPEGGRPLVYFSSRYQTLSPPDPAAGRSTNGKAMDEAARNGKERAPDV